MNIDKVKAALAVVRTEIQNAVNATVTAGQKDPIQFNGLQSLGRANMLCDKIAERLDQAVEKTTAKPKEDKVAKPAAADAKKK